MTEPTNIGVVILAAGSSSRLGQPKQLLEFQNKTLLQHMIDTVMPFNFKPAVLVLGAQADQIKDATDFDDINVICNDQWPEGIASSIRLGVAESLKLNESIESILFLLSDQPFVTKELIEELIQQHVNENKTITACSYQQIVGVPVIFDKNFFPQLMELTGDVGAKKIILQNSQDVGTVAFKKGYFDIDTPEDYEQFQDNVSQ